MPKLYNIKSRTPPFLRDEGYIGERKSGVNSGQVKNIVLVLLLTITMFSVYKFISSLREKYELLDSLHQTQQQAAALEEEKQNLLQEAEKAQQLQQKLTQQNLELKEYLMAGKARLAKLFKTYQGAEKAVDELNSRFSLLKVENTALLSEKERLAKENENLKAKLTSAIELKNAIRQLKKQAQKVGIQIINKTDARKTLEGNQGYIIKDGKPNNPARVTIEVIPALEK